MLTQVLTAGTYFYLPIFLIAIILPRVIPFAKPVLERLALRIQPWIAIGLLTVFFTMTGLYWTFASGAHSGDEGHYLIQAVSLYEDGDLDIRNNLENEIGAEKV